MAEKIRLDKYTEEQAKTHADIEAEIQGFKIGSERWQKEVAKYLGFAHSTMSVGRNPFVPGSGHKYKIKTEIYPDIFGENGFAGKTAKAYMRKDGQAGVPLTEIQNRILSAVHNLMELYVNSGLGIKTRTKGSKQGKIDSAEMSDLQFPNKEEFDNDEYEARSRDVVYNWFMLDIVTNAILESLTPFFKLTKKDVEDIMGAINIEENKNLQELKEKGRELLLKKLRDLARPEFSGLSYRKILLSR